VRKKIKFKKGFSLIEVLVAIAIISVISSIGVGGYSFFKASSEIDLNSQQVANLIRSSQKKAKAVRDDSAWGIDINASRVIIFQGSNFSSRDTNHDQTTSIKGLTSASGVTQIIFSKMTGLPDVSGTLTLGNGASTKNIQINEEGLVSY